MKVSLLPHFVLLVLAAMLLSGCMIVQGYDSESGLVFQDDFNNSQSGWPVFDKPGGRALYRDGHYLLEVLSASSHLAAPLPSDFRFPRDVRIIVEAWSSVSQLEDDNYFGVMCRYQDPYNYYFFVISQDGYYGIGKMEAGNATLLQSEQMQPVDFIQQDGKNLLEAECAGSSLQLSVNGALLGAVQDTGWEMGGIGLLAASGASGKQLVEFDRLLVQVVR